MNKWRRAYKRRLNWQIQRARAIKRALRACRMAGVASAAYAQVQMLRSTPSLTPFDTVRKTAAIAEVVLRTAEQLRATQVP